MPDGTVMRRDEPAPLPAATPFAPRSLEQAMALSEMLCRASVLPAFLRDNPGNMLMILAQAAAWRLNPFALAGSAYSVGGRLAYDGKAIAAAVETSHFVDGGLDYQFAGVGNTRSITVSATRRGEQEPRSVTVRLADVRTNNEQWQRQPDQQLVYHGARVWARRWAPSVLMGVYAREELDGVVVDGVADAAPEPAQLASEPVPVPQLPAPELDAAPPAPRAKVSVREWLRALEAQLSLTSNREEAEALILSEQVLRASRGLQGPARDRLQQIIDAALARDAEELG